MRETTALGAAIAAGLAAGVWKSFAELRDINRAGGTVFEPQISPEQSAESFATWEKAVWMSKGWAGKNIQPELEREENEPTQKPGYDGFPLTKEGLKVSGVKTAVKGRDVQPPIRAFTISSDLQEADEEELLLELRRIEILQRLKRLRKARGAAL